jgi:hypothetical protein
MRVQERTTLSALRNARIVFKCLWRVVKSDLEKVSKKEYFFKFQLNHWKFGKAEEHLDNSKA